MKKKKCTIHFDDVPLHDMSEDVGTCLWRVTCVIGDAAAWADDDLPVTVLDGQLVCGVLRKAHVGTGAGGIVDTICRERDGVACMRFMGDAQRITHEFLLQARMRLFFCASVCKETIILPPICSC